MTIRSTNKGTSMRFILEHLYTFIRLPTLSGFSTVNGSQLHGLKSSCNPSIRRTIYDVNGITSSVTSADFDLTLAFSLRFFPSLYCWDDPQIHRLYWGRRRVDHRIRRILYDRHDNPVPVERPFGSTWNQTCRCLIIRCQKKPLKKVCPGAAWLYFRGRN